MDAPGFLGTGATLKSDLSLMAYILLIVPAMLTGFVFARRKMFVPHHKLMMTSIIIINWIIIFFLMAVSYRDGVLPYVNVAFSDPRVSIPTIHLVTGAIAQILGTYLVFRMWFEKRLPKWVMVRNIKTYMRFTLALWLVTAALGIIIYASFYVRPAQAGDAPAPATTPDGTPEVSSTSEVEPAGTDEAGASSLLIPVNDPATTPELLPIQTEDPCPQQTPELVLTAEIAETDEADADATPAADPTATSTPCVRPAATEDLSDLEIAPATTDDVVPAKTEDADEDNNSGQGS